MTADTPLDLDAIQARADAATPEPWQYSDDASVICNGMQIAQFYKVHSDDDRVADALFTAHARGDVPALVAEVRRLRERVEAVESYCAFLSGGGMFDMLAAQGLRAALDGHVFPGGQ